MKRRAFNHVKYTIERLFVRGATYQLLFVAALIGLVSLLAGGLIFWTSPDKGGFAESIWWAFLRLTDPGYLGDDSGAFRRTVSTVVTVLGYVLFMGSLISILTQWLNTKLKELESGLTPVVRNNHFLVLGWTERVGIVVQELFQSDERVRRFFLRLNGPRRLHIVVLAGDASARVRNELKTRVGPHWKSSQVTLRSGSSLRSEHLSRVDFLHAAAVLLPAGDFSQVGPESVDTHTIKTLLSMSNHPEVSDPQQLPLAVAEILDARKVSIASAAYAGPIEVLAADAIVSQLLAQNIRHRGLSHTYAELLTQEAGNSLFVRDFPPLYGAHVTALAPLFSDAILLGVVRGQGVHCRALLNVHSSLVYEPSDRLVLMARSFSSAAPQSEERPEGLQSASSCTPCPPLLAAGQRRLLILGWSHKVPPLLAELASPAGNSYRVSIASTVATEERQVAIERHAPVLEGVTLQHLELDYTIPSELLQLDAASYDTIVLVGSDWLQTGEEADARTIVGYLMLQKALAETRNRPHVLIEVLDPSNVGLLGKRPGEVLVSPVILSHMLTQVSLRRELSAVFNNLFTSGGAEISFRRPHEYGYVNTPKIFSDFQQDAASKGEVALGIQTLSDGHLVQLRLNPERSTQFCLSAEDSLVVLSNDSPPHANVSHA